MRPPKSFLGITTLIAILVYFSPAPDAGRRCRAAAANGPREVLPISDLPARKPQILYSAQGPIHLGDEEFPDWSRLYGNSWEVEIYLTQPMQSLTLMLQTYGLEINAPVYLNYRKVAVLPRQTITPGTLEKPHDWSPDRIIPLPADKLCLGLNIITITTDLVPMPKFSGDLDDFQIRNLRLIAK